MNNLLLTVELSNGKTKKFKVNTNMGGPGSFTFKDGDLNIAGKKEFESTTIPKHSISMFWTTAKSN